MMKSTHKRGENPEAGEILARIPTLKKILGSNSKIELDRTKVDSSGFMLLSRYNKEDDDTPKIKEKVQKVASEEDGEEVDHVQQKTAEPTGANNSSNNEKKKRYALSLATLASKPHKRQVIVNEGAITVLIELSSVYDKAIQVRCASAFASLTVEPKIRARMLDDGALNAIIALATNSNIREVKTDCARAICNLCCEKGYEFKMVKEGVPFVVTHVASTCPDTFEICLKILMNITCVSDKFARIEDLTEALMYFINANCALNYDQEFLLLVAFRNLASLRNNQVRLVEDGCLKIVDRFFQSQHARFRKMACEILKCITVDSKTHSKLLEQNILHILLLMYHDRDEEIKMLCVKSFLYLSADENFRRQIVDGVALKHLLNLTTGKAQKNEMYQVTAKTLRVLCSDFTLAHKLVESGISKALVMLFRCEDHLIHQFCAEALCGLFQTQDILDRLVEEGVAQELIKLAYQTSNPHSCEWCAFALYQLSRGNINSANETSCRFYESILPCIIYLCELNFSTDITKRFCSAAFAHATLSKSKDMNCAMAIPLLVKMLRDEESQTIKKYCASSLFNLADSNDNCYKMLDSQALKPVVELTQSPHSGGDSDPKVICAGIISRLSLHKQYYDQFASGNVLKVLLELSAVDHRLTQRRVVIALSNLSQNEELKLKLLALNPIPYIISLASERDEYLRRGCISIVCNMSYLPGSEKAIVQAGIIPTLMITSLITSDQMPSKIICVKALINLMADRSQMKSMVRDGVIWGLSKLAQQENAEMLALCAQALRCLSVSFAREMLSSQVAVRTLLRLIDTKDLELMKSGARMLTNILLQTDHSDEEFHRQVVDNMIPLARSPNKELNELCVICLCLASQSESCRTGIVSSGMLQMIDSGTIFSDPVVSFAYITMFGNIANNPAMRSRVLDDHLLERFERICESKKHHLHVAVAKALYCLSCSAENIPKLVDQQIIPMISMMAEVDHGADRSNELLSHLIACLYNLTTVLDVQHKLVSQGFVSVMKNLWSEAEKDKDLCILSYLAICHLACGKTNTTKMVNDGCTSILCFISTYRRVSAYRNYNFSVDLHYRCSAALRNLLSVVSNQGMMVDQGCLNTIIDLANFSTKERSTPYNPADPTSSNFRGVWRNCAVALTSLTYNHEVRDKLVQTEAINIILRNAEVDGGEISLGQGLMRELEAESWDNGARGRHKDGRCKSVKPAKLYTELLRGGSNVKLDVEVKDEPLEKFCVQVQLDEPELTTSSALVAQPEAVESEGGSPLDLTGDLAQMSLADQAHAASVQQAAASALHHTPSHAQLQLQHPQQNEDQHRKNTDLKNNQDKELSIDVLHPYEDTDDGFGAVTYAFEKQECAMETETVALFRIDDNLEESASVLTDELNNESAMSLPVPNHNQPGKASLTSPQGSFKSYDSFSGVLAAPSADSAMDGKKGFLPGLNNPVVAMFYNQATSPPPNQAQSQTVPIFPPLMDAETMRAKKAEFNRSIKKASFKPSAKEKQFSNLVSMIKDAKEGKNANIDEVVSKWKDVSRF